MKYRDLKEAIGKILPSAQFEEDNDGQIVIYSDLEEMPNGNLETFSPPEPIGKCSRCSVPVYISEGFCGNCRG